MDVSRTRALLEARKEPKFRVRQVLDAVYKGAVSRYAEATALPAPLREALDAAGPILSVKESAVRVSADGRAHKAVLVLSDGLAVESVLLRPKPELSWTTCISCQVGCAIGCTFCATGLMGLKRGLTAEEITDQVLFWRQYLRAGRAEGALDRVVYMGMGEPFHCYDVVAESLRWLTDPGRFAMADRHISVSTAGVAPGIARFVEDFPQVNLALSLHAADDELRGSLVPINRAYPLARLARELKRSLDKNRRKIFLEYCLLAGENDGVDHAADLVRFVRSVGREDLLHVNLIVWNPTDTPHRPSGEDSARRFKELLISRGVHVTIRKNLGTDIQGACGQLITAKDKSRAARAGKAGKK